MPAPRVVVALAALAALLASGLFIAAPAWALDPPPLLRDYGPMWGRGGWDG